ncbi:hypothetical protein ACS0TY_026296 [Phlomoides rotata]
MQARFNFELSHSEIVCKARNQKKNSKVGVVCCGVVSCFCKCGYYGMESRHSMNGNDTQALDEKQNEVITPASNELAQRKADLEVNLNLLNELKVNFDRFSARVDQLKTSSVSYFSGLANEHGKGGKQAPVQFVNISDLQVDNTWSEGIFFSNATEGLKENLEEEKLDAEMDIFKEEYAEETGFDEKQDDVVLVTEMDTFGEEEAAYAQLSPQETFEKGEEQTLSDSVKPADESESEFSQIQGSRLILNSWMSRTLWINQNLGLKLRWMLQLILHLLLLQKRFSWITRANQM